MFAVVCPLVWDKTLQCLSHQRKSGNFCSKRKTELNCSTVGGGGGGHRGRESGRKDCPSRNVWRECSVPATVELWFFGAIWSWGGLWEGWGCCWPNVYSAARGVITLCILCIREFLLPRLELKLEETFWYDFHHICLWQMKTQTHRWYTRLRLIISQNLIGAAWPPFLPGETAMERQKAKHHSETPHLKTK